MGCFWKALFVLFASGLSPVLRGTLRGNCFGRALTLTSSSSPLSLMGSLKLEEIKPPQFALSRDELSRLRKDIAHSFSCLPKAPPSGDSCGSSLLPILSPSVVPICSILLHFPSPPFPVCTDLFSLWHPGLCPRLLCWSCCAAQAQAATPACQGSWAPPALCTRLLHPILGSGNFCLGNIFGELKRMQREKCGAAA